MSTVEQNIDRAKNTVKEGEEELLDLNFGFGEPIEDDEEDKIDAQAEDDGDEVEALQEDDSEPDEDEADQKALAQEVDDEEEKAPEIKAEAEDEEAETAEATEEPKKSLMVPKARLDEVLEKLRLAERQLQEATRVQQPDEGENAPQAPEYDFDAKEIEYQNLVLDGEQDKAVALRREIRQAERAVMEFELTQKVQQTAAQTQSLNAYQQAVVEVERSFPMFDINSPDFNEALTNEVVDLSKSFMAGGKSSVDALMSAVKYVVKANDLDVDEATPAVAKALDTKKKRVVDAASKKTKAANSQPDKLGGEGTATRDSGKYDIASMTEEEFNNLPEKTLKRLRGDIL